MTSPASILIVDDTPANLALLGSILEKAGFEIRVATNGPDALSIAASQPAPDLILLDILMPDMDGMEICRRLKSDPSTAAIPIIFVSGLGEITDKVKAFQEGAVDFITKPFEPDEIVVRVRTHLSLARMEMLAAEIEERKRSEKALIESQALLAMSQRIGRIGSWNWQIPTGQVTWSDETYRIFGIARPCDGELLNQIILKAIHPDDRKRITEVSRCTERQIDPVSLRFAVVHPDGSIHHVQVEAGEPELDSSGAPLSLHGIVQDITERLAAEEEKSRLEASVAQARKLESLGLMAGGIAHDFNNMLGVIIGHAEIAMRKAAEGTPVAVGLSAILKAANRSAELTRQLLSFASHDSIHPEVLDADTAIGSILERIRKDLRPGLSLAWTPGAESCRIRVDPIHLEQILSKLCSNAAEASGETGLIAVATSVADHACDPPEGPRTEKRLAITFSDEGNGIPPHLMERIFDPFFTTKPRGKGIGLGLSTVLGAVRQNDGLIEVESRIEEGTTFRILFPCCQPQRKAASPANHGQAIDRNGETILVVEDHPDVLAMTSMILEHLGFQVLATVNPWHALDLLRKHHDEIRLLLTDVVMPGMNGRELVAQAKEVAPTLRYIYCSGYTADVMASRGPPCEGMDFIQKPYSIEDLHRKVREVLDRP